MCTHGWNHYLESLRQYVEVGHGMPQGSDRIRLAAVGLGHVRSRDDS